MVAYIPRLMIHHYAHARHLLRERLPVQPMKVMYTDTSSLEDYGDSIVALESLRAASTNEVISGPPVRRVRQLRPDQAGWALSGWASFLYRASAYRRLTYIPRPT